MIDGKQLANHLPGLKYICQKQRLVSLMEDYYWKTAGESDCKTKLFELMPKTYRLDNSAESLAFINDTDEGIYIQKRFFMNRGMGIELIYDLKEYKDELKERKKFSIDYSMKACMKGNKYVEKLDYTAVNKEIPVEKKELPVIEEKAHTEEINQVEAKNESENQVVENDGAQPNESDEKVEETKPADDTKPKKVKKTRKFENV